METLKLDHYRRVIKPLNSGCIRCRCGRRISPNKKSCLACAEAAGGKAQGAATPGPRKKDKTEGESK
jgi:hypothetical protein